MKFFKTAKKYGSKIALASTGLMATGLAHATIETDAQAALDAAEASALTVGGYVVGAVAALIVIGLVISMVRKV